MTYSRRNGSAYVIPVEEARKRLKEIFDDVAAGETVLVTSGSELLIALVPKEAIKDGALEHLLDPSHGAAVQDLDLRIEEAED